MVRNGVGDKMKTECEVFSFCIGTTNFPFRPFMVDVAQCSFRLTLPYQRTLPLENTFLDLAYLVFCTYILYPVFSSQILHQSPAILYLIHHPSFMRPPVLKQFTNSTFPRLILLHITFYRYPSRT